MDEAEISAIMHKIKHVKWTWKWKGHLIDDALIEAVRSPEMMGKLVEQLGSEDYFSRSVAGFALAEIAGEIARPELIKALSSDWWRARAQSARELWHYQDSQLTQHLIPLLNDSELPVRSAATYSLAMLRDPSSVPHLIAAIEDTQRNMLDSASEALYMIAQEHEIPELFPYLKSENVHLRIAAAYALGAKGGKDAVQGLIDLVRVVISSDEPEYERAHDQLQLIGEPAVAEVIEALNERDKVLSQFAIEVLVSIGDLRGVPHIVAAMGDEDEQVYKAATWGAGEFGEAAIPQLAEALKSENPRLRMNVAQALGNVQDASVLKHLVNLIHDDDSEVRQVALFGLGEIGDLTVIQHILPLLHGPAQDQQNQRTTASYAAQVLKFQLSTPEALAAVERWKKEEAGKGI